MTAEQLRLVKAERRLAEIEGRLVALESMASRVRELYAKHVEKLRRFFAFVTWPDSLA